MGRHGKRQPEIHARGVVLDWRVDELLDLGKRHDLIEFSGDLGPPHPEDGAV
jgi:hypothetical protein